MRRYGALRTFMVLTWVVFGIGYLAIIGVPPFAGFFSKDEIIHAAWAEHPVAGLAALIGAGVTGFYMTRMMAMTFYGKARWEDDVHPHESPQVDDGPDDRPGHRRRPRRLHAALRRQHRGVAGAGGRLRGGRGRAPDAGHDRADADRGRRRRGHRLAAVRDARRSRGRPDAGLGAHGRRPQRPLRRRGQRGGVHAPRPVPDPHAGLDRQQDHRRGGERHRRRHRRAQRADAPLADRLRPVLRPVHVARRRGRRRRPGPGECLL